MQAATELSQTVGVQRACQALGIPRASYYRQQRTTPKAPTASASPSPRALTSAERQSVREVLYSARFLDQTPRQVYATLLDEGQYLCSVRTMYRLLDEEQAARERRDQLRHPQYQKPELLATAPNQVWSWDITKLLGPQKWTYYYLYVILDIYSRYVVGWMLAHRECQDLAARLIRDTVQSQQVGEQQLTIHSDRGPSMTSQTVAQLLGTLSVTKSHSRPHVSNDNPFSESQFKTLKYSPDFPERFDSYEQALAFCRGFFAWYNDEHYHSTIGLLTPAMLHYGQAEQVLQARQGVLEAAYAAHPERFVKGPPAPSPIPLAVWINPPTPASQTDPAHKKRLPENHCPQEPNAPLVHPRLGYPSSGCSPALPDSVSPSNFHPNPPTNPIQCHLVTQAMPPKTLGGLGGKPPREAPITSPTQQELH